MHDRHRLSGDVDIRTAKRTIRHRKNLSKNAGLVWVFFLLSPSSSPVLLSKQCCPVNCVVSGFGPFSGCSASCGGGTQSRSRSIVTSPSCGGSGCPSLTVRKETKRGRVSFPPVCFELHLWPYFRVCLFVSPNALLQDTISCNTGCCPQNCQVSSWSNWGQCSLSCGSGKQP